MSRIAEFLVSGFTLLGAANVAAQSPQPSASPDQAPIAESANSATAPSQSAAAPSGTVEPTAPSTVSPPPPATAVQPLPAAPPPNVEPVPAPAAPAQPAGSTVAPNVVLAPPEYAPRIVVLPPQRERRVEHDRRAFTFGIGPLVLANVHWLDQPANKAVSVGNRQSVDEQYPGFLGLDATLGLTLDVRYEHFIGVELDFFLQNDRGTGTIKVEDAGSICFIPGVNIPYPTHSYDVTIGQLAWHVPVLFKLSLPGRWETVHGDGDVDREIRKSFGTLAFGPEFVFPRAATFSVEPASGLDHPEQAFASNYVMLTGALGFERRVSDSHDIRLLLSARGSYNPWAEDSAMKRARYDIAGGNVVAIAYRSEWRYQAAFTFGVGWFF